MFPTSGIRAANYTNENSDNLLQAKKGGGLLSPRRPLHDKAVNERNFERQKKGKQSISKDLKVSSSPCLFNNDLWADICTYKDVEDEMEDIWPHTGRLGVSGIVNILESYANKCSTPTPEHWKDFNNANLDFVETPGSHFNRFEVFSDYDMCVQEISVGDVSLPALDMDSF